MTSLLHWISPRALESLGWALLHFLWQGTALAALAAAAMALSRKSSTRYVIGVATLLLMLAAPAATFWFHSTQDAPATEGVKAASRTTAWISASTKAATAGVIQSAAAPSSMNLLSWLVEAWLLGVAFFSLRSAGGFVLLERERRRQSSVVREHLLAICNTLQERLGIRRAIQFCECAWLQAPAVIGWFRPIVFLPAAALSGLSEEQLQSVIAHELAHIKRLDPFVNVFQVGVETLLFYHPAVWWLNRRIRAEREHCCDEMAVELCGNAVEYARALTMMEEWRSAPGLAMAVNRGPLTERVLRVLGLKTLGAGVRSIGLTGSVVCLTAALIAGNALLGIARPKIAQAASVARFLPATPVSPAQQATSAPAAKPSAAHTPTQSTQATSATSYIDAMKAAGLGDLTVDQLIALKTQDVTPEYVRELQQQGFHPNVDSIIAMRVQDVSPEYIRDLRAAGLNPNQDQIIALKVQDADAAYYRSLKEAGIDVDVNTLIALKVQDVTPEYVRSLRASGLAVNTDQIIGMKVQDVTPEYVKQMRDLGIQPSANEIIAMRVQDVTPEWVRGIQALGFKPSGDELIAMRVQDVTPDYIKALQSAGFKLDINDIIEAKVQDVTPEFIEQAKKHGFKDLTFQKLIQLRQLGILDSKADL
jgi:beta-lactamase regulating signal transducer with metallopeptidase domain/uncharacterized protein YnzC (UPF0291/DUF896 family)